MPTFLRTYRITPAGAGKSNYIVNKKPDDEDHPRGCGEKIKINPWSAIMRGSPPRVRGKAIRRHAVAVLGGITPAGAGKRHCHVGRLHLYWDHPRGCGEKAM